MLPHKRPHPTVVIKADVFSISLYDNASEIKYEEAQIKEKMEKKKIRHLDFW